MINIAFLTSSRSKIAHAKHLCQAYNVNIYPNKHIYYGVSYNEPRILDRDELLKRSVEDATSRWKKYRKLTKASNLFILEDTSVRINALSSSNNEVPGVDIKYWMRDNDFKSVDKILKNLGNDRRVRVQSHLVLYLTYDLQKDVEKEYIVFTSYCDGYITDKEYSFSTQPTYPWLDNRTFNKWFVPEGYRLPISMLPIEEADKVDFRRGAFTSMLGFLKEHKIIYNSKEEVYDWRLGLDPFIVICGPTCSGKTTSARYLSLKYNFYHVEASDFMYLNYYETHGTMSGISISSFAKEALLKNPNIVVDRVIKHINEVGNKAFVVTGFRSPNEVLSLQNKLALDKNYKLIYLDAENTVRFKRWKERNRDDQPLTIEEFTANNKIQNEIGLSKIAELDCVNLYNNFSNFEEYYSYLSYELNLEKYEIFRKNLFEKFSDADAKYSMEDLIITTLLYENIINNEYDYYTTTQISHLIFKRFNKKKYKDNISRYFNQRYYPYYELKGEKDKILIRLSPTGVSKGLTILDRFSQST